MSPAIKDWGEPRGRPGILLDRDGTINVDYHYVGHIERVQLIPGAADAIRRFNQAGIPVAVVTNQSGVARGFYTEDDVIDVHQYIQRELALHDAHIDLFIYSPHHPDGNIDKYRGDDVILWHKPNTGMAKQAEQILNLDLHESWVVGDRITDIEMAYRIGANAIYLGKEPTLPQWEFEHFRNYRFASLAEAAGFIIERITDVPQSEFPVMSYTGMISYWHHYGDEIRTVTANMRGSDIAKAAEVLIRAYEGGRNVFIAGNGGAASIANHFECDHTNHLAHDNLWFTNIHSLSANIELITATANDIGYDSIFSYQLERKAQLGDVLMVFTVSGNSANIVRAIQCALELGMQTIAVIACDGGKVAGMKVAGLIDAQIHIPTSNYGIAEDVMQMIMHSMAQFIRQTRMSDRAIQSARF
jgi:D-sedoheptulose 7-phosphate isomerase/D-glycero-D-manno-heptose 1,7-bisphosphate phosphatase